MKFHAGFCQPFLKVHTHPCWVRFLLIPLLLLGVVWARVFIFSHCRNPNVVSTFLPRAQSSHPGKGFNCSTSRAGPLPLPLPLPLPKELSAKCFPQVLRRSRTASNRERISPRLVEGVPFLMGILLVVLPFFAEGVMWGLVVDGLPFIMRFNHCSTGPVTKSPSSSSSSSPGGQPGAPTPVPPGN